MADEITKNMGIMEVVQNHPQAAPVFAQFGLGCVGCMAAQFESIEEGAKAHGMDDKKVDEMVEALNKAVQDAS
ncbi:MAG: DUF1858 domain-containing protein [Nanoarchaeota archaeon]